MWPELEPAFVKSNWNWSPCSSKVFRSRQKRPALEPFFMISYNPTPERGAAGPQPPRERREGDNFEDFDDFHRKNGSSQGQREGRCQPPKNVGPRPKGPSGAKSGHLWHFSEKLKH